MYQHKVDVDMLNVAKGTVCWLMFRALVLRQSTLAPTDINEWFSFC